MERDANYIAVGAFMLLLIAMGVGFLLWYSEAGDRRDYTRYEINFAGSVSGLDKGSAVRYLGVDVGRVRELSLDRERPSEVTIIVEIDETAPISSATRASLSLQGITGLLFINLKQVPDADPNGPLPQGRRYPVIESMTSDFDVLLATLPEVVGRASSLMSSIDQVFSDKNIIAVTDMLENLRAATQGLPKTADNLGAMVEEFRATVREVNAAAVTIRGIADDSRPQVQMALERLRAAADNLSTATERVDRFVANAEGQVGHLSEHGLFELERMVRDVRVAAIEFRDLSRSLKQQPSQLMYEKPPSGMEIPR